MKNGFIVFIVIALFSQKGFSQSFQDTPEGEIGEFPSNWRTIQGEAEIASINGHKAIKLFNKALIKPNSGNTNYLHTAFELQFDAYFEAVSSSFTGTHYDIRFWDGASSTVSYKNEGGEGSVKSLIIYRHGAKLVTNYNGKYTTYDEYKKELQDRNAVWRPVKITYQSNTLELYIDNVPILTVPNYGYEPRIVSFEGYAKRNGEQLLCGIKKIALVGNADNINTTEDHNGTNDTNSTVPDNANSATSETSGLEAIDEGRGTGWRLIGKDPKFFGDIGGLAVDLSHGGTTNSNSGATGNYSFATGINTIASGNASAAIGGASTTTASGTEAVAIGSGSTASGVRSLAASGGEASGVKALAMGSGSKALDEYAIAIGKDSQARAYHTVAIGTEAEARNGYATAIGYKTKAKGPYSTALGHETTANSYGVVVIGRHNIGFGNRTDWFGIDPVFEVGVGEDANNTKNGFTILKNGNVGITEHLPRTKLHITGGTDVSLNYGSGYVAIGKESAKNLAFDNNEIMARDNGKISVLYLQHDGGDVHVGGSVVQNSDFRLKRNITPLHYGLNEILQLDPKSYYWKNREDDQKSFGLIAQEVQPIINEVVKVGTDKEKNLGLDYTALIPVLINAIKEQQAIIDTQNKKIEDLSENLTEKENTLNDLNDRVKRIESFVVLGN